MVQRRHAGWKRPRVGDEVSEWEEPRFNTPSLTHRAATA